MESALALAIEQTEAEGCRKIHRIDLNVGELCGAVPDALLFAFDVVSKGTVAEGAELHIETVSTLCYCQNCRREFDPMGWIYQCPRCQKISQEIRRGQVLELVSLEAS